MSKYNKQPHRQGDQTTGQSVHCYQSVWMARLTQTNSSLLPQGHNGLSLSLMSNINGDAKKFTEITDMRTIRIMNEGVAATETLDCLPFPMSNAYQNIGSKNGLDIPSGQVSHPQFGFKVENNGIRTVRQFSSVLGSREHVFEKVSQCLEDPMTQMIPHRANKGKAPEVSFDERHEKAKQLALVSTSENYLSNAATLIDTNCESNHVLRKFSILGRDKKLDDLSTSGPYGNSFLKRCNASFAGEPSKKMRNLPRSDFLPSQITTVKETKSINLSPGGYEYRRMPGPIPDMEKTEILNGNSMDGDGATFFKMTQNLLCLENANNHKNKQQAGVKQSSGYSFPKRSMFSQMLSLSPPLGLGRKGVEIELLDSASDSQGKHDVRESLSRGVCQKNESSAETATMDMDTFAQQNNFSGVNYSTSKKNLSVGHDLPSQATIASDRKKVKSKRTRTRLLDMNEIPVLQVSSNSMDNTNPSTSKTQSLDAEHLFHNESPTHNKTEFPNRLPTVEPISAVEPSGRWLKRLKLSAPHSCGAGTKNSNFEESLSHRKVNKLFSEVIGGSDTCSFGRPLSNKYNRENDSVANKSPIVLQRIDPPPKKDLDILLSHSWIKRWCRVSTQKKKLEGVLVCEPQSTKLDFNELQRKQFPSIDAMALMGKALNGFQPCEFRKRGSFVVWNTKDL